MSHNFGVPVIAWLAVLCLTACAGRGEFQFAEADPNATAHKIWVSKLRSDVQAGAQGAPPRPGTLSFEAITVSVPATHAPGEIEWPDGPPDAQTDFVSIQQSGFDTIRGFAADISRSDTVGRSETLVFVHGYNTRHAEAVYQLTQFVHDFEVPVPPVLFSWPSAGVTAGYVYDRDSALLARDHLESTIIALTQDGRKVVLVGHSMGSYLIMETLRQIALKGSLDIEGKIEALTLMAPDIDGELFRDQAMAIGDLPDPFILMVAEQDRALRISSLLTGLRPRLGSQTDRAIVGDLPISVVDVSDLAAGGEFNHKIATTSPAAIAILREMAQQAPPGETHIGALVVLSQIAR
ncbi:MAG: alpha/beta hydrolase [Paracoccaceae bacterium]